MENCLFTQMKAEVATPLPKLGAFSFMFDSDGIVESTTGSVDTNGNFAVDSDEDADGNLLVMTSDTYTQVVSNGATTRILPWTINDVPSQLGYGITLPSVANNAVVHFGNAYKSLGKINLSALKNVRILNENIIPHLEALSLFRATGAFGENIFNIDLFAGLQNLTKIVINNNNLKGSLQNVVNATYINLSNDEISTAQIREIIGNIEIFSGNTEITQLSLNGQPLVTGDVETLLDAMAVSRTSGTLKLRVAGTACTSTIGYYPNVTFTSDRVTYPRGWHV